MKQIFISLSMLCLVASCKKNIAEIKPNTPAISKRQAIFPTTQQEIKTANTVKEVTEIVKEVYRKQPLAIKEVNDLIKVRFYKDEYVFLEDLLQPEKSRLYLSTRTANVQNKGVFKAAFVAEISANNTNQRTTDGSDFSRYLQDDISIYFPYQDKFDNVTTVTLVPADRDGDEAPGYITNGRGGYTEVLASDQYSQTNPCHLLGITSIDKTEAAVYQKVEDEGFDPAGRCTGIVYNGIPENQLPPPPSPPGTAQTNEIRQAYIGYSKCQQQYDAWISLTGNGGGSEIMYSRGDGYLKFVDDHVTDFQEIIRVDHTRSDINDKRAIYVLAAWDYQWEPGNNQQYFAIWEDDNRGSVNFKFNVGTTVTIDTGTTATGSIGFDITKKSQDAIIRQFQIDYNTYFRDGRNNQGHGFLVGYSATKQNWCSYTFTYQYDYSYIPSNQSPWPKRDWRSGVGWTWPYKII